MLAAYEAIAAAEQERLVRAVARWLAPALAALRSGREPTSPERRRLVLVGVLSLAAAGWLVAGPLAGAALGASAPWLARIALRRRTARRQAAIAAEAPVIARALADALAGGHSVRGALLAAARGGGVRGPAAAELHAVAAALELGERTDDVLRAFARRAGAGPCETLVAAILLQRDAGGDLAGLLRSLASALEARARVVAEARSSTAQARFTALLVCGLPFAGLALAELAQPGFLVALASTPVTAVMIAVAVAPAGRRRGVRAADRARGGTAMTALLAALAGVLAAAAIVELAHGAAMTAVLAALAGVLAAAAIVELVAAPRPAAPSARRAQPGGHLGGMTILLARIARATRAPARAAPADLQARIAAAGVPLGLTAPDVMALKGATALIGLLLAFPLATALPGRLGLVALAAAPAAGFFAPDLALGRRARSRGARMADELPDVLDLLRVAVQAGLPVGRALAEVGRRCSGPLAAELDAAAARMRLGATRDAALSELVARCPADGVAALAAAVARADRHGAPLAPALEALAAQARAEQARRLRDAAARAAPKIQLVVALVLVPAVMLLVAAVLVQALT